MVSIDIVRMEILSTFLNECVYWKTTNEWASNPPPPQKINSSALGGSDPHLTHRSLASPHLPPNGSPIASHVFTEQRHKFPIGYNGPPHIHPKIAHFRGAINTPINIAHSWTHSTNHPKRHPNPVN